MVAVFNLLPVLASMSLWREQVFKCIVRSFIILLSGEGLISFSVNNRTNFFVEKK